MATVTGGDKLEGVLQHIAQATAGEPSVKVGFLSGATYPARARTALRTAYAKRRSRGITKPIAGDAGTINVATVAFFQEHGTATIPSRPFFRNMIRKKSKEWGAALAIQLHKTGYDAARSLAVLGEGIAGQLRESIIDTNAPPLAPSTIARKGFSKPLVDTAHMLMSVDYEVNS